MLSTPKTEISIWSVKTGEMFLVSVVGPLGILVDLVKIKIGQGYSKSGRFFGRPSMRPFLDICFSLEIETRPKRWWVSWDFFWKCTYSWDNNITVYMRFEFENLYLKTFKIALSLVGWYPRMALRFNKITMFKRLRRNLLKNNIKFEGAWWDGVGRVTWKIINWSQCIYNGTVMKVT